MTSCRPNLGTLACLLIALAGASCATSPNDTASYTLSLVVDQANVPANTHSQCLVQVNVKGPEPIRLPFTATGPGIVQRIFLTANSSTLRRAPLDSVRVQLSRIGSDTLVYLTGAYTDTLQMGPGQQWFCRSQVPFGSDPGLLAAGYANPLTAGGRALFNKSVLPD